MDTLLKLHKFITVIESLREVGDFNQKIALESISEGFLVCHEKQLLESIEEKLNYLVDSNVSDKEKASVIKNAIANAGDLKNLFLRARKLMKDSYSMQRAKEFLESTPVVMEAISGNANDMVLALISALGLAPAPVMQPMPVEQVIEQPVAPIVEQPIATEVPVEQTIEQPVVEEEIVETQPAIEPPVEDNQQVLPESVQRQIDFIKKYK